MVLYFPFSHFKKSILTKVIYKKGDKPETFYIIREGKICLESNIDLEKANKWPTVMNRKY